ncbi:MAG: hypothetical protein AB1Z98_19885 [Nannocystaceae bacterium]
MLASAHRGLLLATLLAACDGGALQADPRERTLQLSAQPVVDEAPIARGGYWLSVDLVGPAAAQQAAALELGEGLVLRDPAEQPPPGILLGHEALVQDAIAWVDAHAFEPRPPRPSNPRALHREPAPVPAGGLLERHGATLVAFIVSGATPELRPRPIDWPLDQLGVLPPGSTWLAAALVPERAPIFAAPAPAIPPAAEAHALAHRRGGLFVLGWVDRCTEAPAGLSCLRWAQVVARDGDRFTPGYLPMLQVARHTAWVPSTGALPRAQLIATGMDDGRAQWLLLARGIDNQLHRRTLTAAAPSPGWPDAELRVDANTAVVSLGDEEPLVLPLGPSLDARARPGPSAPDESDDE